MEIAVVAKPKEVAASHFVCLVQGSSKVVEVRAHIGWLEVFPFRTGMWREEGKGFLGVLRLQHYFIPMRFGTAFADICISKSRKRLINVSLASLLMVVKQLHVCFPALWVEFQFFCVPALLLDTSLERLLIYKACMRLRFIFRENVIGLPHNEASVWCVLGSSSEWKEYALVIVFGGERLSQHMTAVPSLKPFIFH